MAKQGKKKSTKENSNEKSPKRAKGQNSSKLGFLKNFWQEKSPVFKFITAFAACIVLFYILYYSFFFQDYVKPPLLTAQTAIGAVLLNLFGLPVAATGDVLAGAGASVKVAGGCDGLEATALLLAAILVFPIPFKFKWPGLLAGLVVLSILNIIRIAGLYVVKLYWPGAFDFMHVQGGLYLFSFVTILLMLIWANWALKGYQEEITSLKQKA